jgi:spore coat polysaccharide biosynthesis protein SpsF
MKIKEASIITARTSSRRLPNKTIMKIKDDLKSIDIVIQRAKKIGYPVILATSTDPSDDVLVDIAKQHNIEIFRGSLLNKIKRWYDCFKEYQIEYACIIEADDIAFDYDLYHYGMMELEKNNIDMIMYPDNIVTGLFLLNLRKNAIDQLFTLVPDEKINTDVVITKLLAKTKLKISHLNVDSYAKDKKIRLTLDYSDDLNFFIELFKNIDILSSGKTIIDFCENNKSIMKINFHRHKDYLENQEKSVVKNDSK